MKRGTHTPKAERWTIVSLPHLAIYNGDEKIQRRIDGTTARLLAYLCYTHRREDDLAGDVAALDVNPDTLRGTIKRLRDAFPNLLDEDPGLYRLRSEVRCDAARLRNALRVSEASPEPSMKYESIKPVVELYKGPFATALDGAWESERRRDLHRSLDTETLAIASWLKEGGRVDEAATIRSKIVSNLAIKQGLTDVEATKAFLNLSQEAGRDVRQDAADLADAFGEPTVAQSVRDHANEMLRNGQKRTSGLDPGITPIQTSPAETPSHVSGKAKTPFQGASSPIAIAVLVVGVVFGLGAWSEQTSSSSSIAAPSTDRGTDPTAGAASVGDLDPAYLPLMNLWSTADYRDFHLRLTSLIPSNGKQEIDARILYRADEQASVLAGREDLLGLMLPERLSIDARPVQALAFSPDGRTLYSGHGELVVPVGEVSKQDEWPICVWEVGSPTKPKRLLAHGNAVLSLTVSPNGKTLLSTGRDGKAFLWDRSSLRPIVEFVQPPFKDPLPPYRLTTSEIPGACFLSDTEILGALHDGMMRWVLPKGAGSRTGIVPSALRVAPESRILRKAKDASEINFSTIQANGGRILTSGGANVVYLWEPGLENPAAFHNGESRNSVFPAVFSPDGLRFATGSTDHDVRVWKADLPQNPSLVLKGLDSEVHTLAFSATGRRLVTGDQRGRISIWDLAAGRRLLQLVLPNFEEIRAVAVAPNDSALAVAGHDGHIYLWRLRNHSSREDELPDGTETHKTRTFAPSPGILPKH